MPRLAANLNYLFTEVEFPRRFEAAAKAGFRAVEYQFPYEHDKHAMLERLREHRLDMVLINLPAGDVQSGDAGIACDPGRRQEFRDGVEKGIDYARTLGCPQLNCLAGIAPAGHSPGELFDTFVDNLRYAAKQLSLAGLRLLIEPINTRDRPGFYLCRSTQAMEIIDSVSEENLFLQFDVYHTQIMQGDIVRNFEAQRERIRHVQIADNPGRHEPGTGELNFDFILDSLDAMGYEGWVSCEYSPSTNTEESLAWARRYLERSQAR